MGIRGIRKFANTGEFSSLNAQEPKRDADKSLQASEVGGEALSVDADAITQHTGLPGWRPDQHEVLLASSGATPCFHVIASGGVFKWQSVAFA